MKALKKIIYRKSFLIPVVVVLLIIITFFIGFRQRIIQEELIQKELIQEEANKIIIHKQIEELEVIKNERKYISPDEGKILQQINELEDLRKKQD